MCVQEISIGSLSWVKSTLINKKKRAYTALTIYLKCFLKLLGICHCKAQAFAYPALKDCHLQLMA